MSHYNSTAVPYNRTQHIIKQLIMSDTNSTQVPSVTQPQPRNINSNDNINTNNNNVTPGPTTPRQYGTRQSPASSSNSKPNVKTLQISDYPYILPGKVFFRDCDMYFHVNNATYYHYFDNLFNTFFVEEGGL